MTKGPQRRVWRIVRTIPRVLILFPLWLLVKAGELSGALYDILSPHLPGYDT